MSATSQGPPALCKNGQINTTFFVGYYLELLWSGGYYEGTRRKSSNTLVPFQCWETCNSSSVTATTCRNLTEPNGPWTGGNRRSSARSMCCKRHSKSDPSRGQCQETWSPAKKELPVWKTYLARACNRAAGHVGGVASPDFLAKRKVSSKPKPLGNSGPEGSWTLPSPCKSVRPKLM